MPPLFAESALPSTTVVTVTTTVFYVMLEFKSALYLVAAFSTYDLGESSLEMVNPDVVFNSLQLLDEGNLSLHTGSELLLGNPCQLIDLIQVLVDHDDVLFDDWLSDH